MLRVVAVLTLGLLLFGCAGDLQPRPDRAYWRFWAGDNPTAIERVARG